MERCKVPPDTLIGIACRKITGERLEDCYLYQAVRGEPTAELAGLIPFIEEHVSSCPWKQQVLEHINLRLRLARE